MIPCRSCLSGIHLEWRVSSITNVLLGTPVNRQHRRLSYLRKMEGDNPNSMEFQKKKSLNSSWALKSLQPSPNEGMTSQRATDRGYSSKIMKGDMKRTATGIQVLSVRKCSSSTSDGVDHTKYSAASSIPSFYSSNGTEENSRYESSSVNVESRSLEQGEEGRDAPGSIIHSEIVDEIEKHVVSVKVDSTLLRFIKGKGGATQRQIEQETGVKIIFPTSRGETTIVIEGSSTENVNEAVTKVNGAIEDGIRSPFLDYSHFISLPLAIHPELVKKLDDFQNSIIVGNHASDEENINDTQFQEVETTLEMNTNSRRSNSSVLSGLGIDRSIFIKPKTFHLTILMLKLWNKERVAAAAEVLQKISPEVLEALDNRPLSVRLKGLECMKGSPARARVVYAPVEEIGGEGRLIRACEIITKAYTQAGLVLEKDSQQTLKLHATLMNARHRKRNKKNCGNKMSRRREESFDAREIFEKYGSENWGEYLIREAHLSQRFLFCESGYYHCCAALPFPA